MRARRRRGVSGVRDAESRPEACCHARVIRARAMSLAHRASVARAVFAVSATRARTRTRASRAAPSACARARVERRRRSSALSRVAVTRDHRRGDATLTRAFFGVGAPEALVIGVVALLVFGPKGLADIAKQVGATIREFQPTIRELQEASREFQDTLRDEIERPLDEVRNEMRDVVTGPPTPKKRAGPAGEGMSEEARREANAGVSIRANEPAVRGTLASDDYVDEDMKARAAAAAWGQSESVVEESAAKSAGEVDESSASPAKKDVADP